MLLQTKKRQQLLIHQLQQPNHLVEEMVSSILLVIQPRSLKLRPSRAVTNLVWQTSGARMWRPLDPRQLAHHKAVKTNAAASKTVTVVEVAEAIITTTEVAIKEAVVAAKETITVADAVGTKTVAKEAADIAIRAIEAVIEAGIRVITTEALKTKKAVMNGKAVDIIKVTEGAAADVVDIRATINVHPEPHHLAAKDMNAAEATKSEVDIITKEVISSSNGSMLNPTKVLPLLRKSEILIFT
jgi:phosphopantetheine adenylyltransferase